MKWLMALLAVVALGEAGLSVCASGHAHAQDVEPVMLMAVDGDHSAHAGHGAHAPDHSSHAMMHSSVAPAIGETPDPAGTDHCPDCATGRSCSDCAVLSVNRTSGFEAAALPALGLKTAHYSDVALTRIATFDPPPPKALTSI